MKLVEDPKELEIAEIILSAHTGIRLSRSASELNYFDNWMADAAKEIALLSREGSGNGDT